MSADIRCLRDHQWTRHPSGAHVCSRCGEVGYLVALPGLGPDEPEESA